jgi:hypothetical protein
VAALAFCAAAPAAQGAFDDPIFIYRPKPPPPPNPLLPPPSATLEGPCGLAVDAAGDFYVSDYYHHVVDVFGFNQAYLTQLAEEDPLDGPCGLAIGSGESLYVNNYHRNVVKFGPQGAFGPGTVIAGVGATAAAPEDSTHPTGVAVNKATGDVYVDERTHVTIYSSAGAEVKQVGSFADGHGVAVSAAGLIYVPDAATNKVEIYKPSISTVEPVGVIDGAGTPAGRFTSLRDSSIAVDRVSGEIYVVDNLDPEYTDDPEAVVYVFDSAGNYKGRLKYSIEDALPAGLAVDNSTGATQGRVYVTSGNSELAAVYAYLPHAATSEAVPLPRPLAPGGGEGKSGSSAAPPAPAAGAGTQSVATAVPAGPADVMPASAGAMRTDEAGDRLRHRKPAAKHRHRSRKGSR